MKKFEDDFTTVEWCIVIVCAWIIAFCIGFTAPDAIRVLIPVSEQQIEHNEINQYFAPIPDTILSQYYNDGGHVEFVDRKDWVGYKWSVGYYTYPDNSITICWDIGKLDTYEQILAHEMAHYIYFTDEEFDTAKWQTLAALECKNSQYYKILDSKGGHYYADPSELFAQQSSLYMQATSNNSYTADRDAQIMWTFEKTVCPGCCEFIENYYSLYYN